MPSARAFDLPESPLRELGEVTSFFGRAKDGEALARAFDAPERLVTLLGPGGMGKTRLAKRFGAFVATRGERVAFVDVTLATSFGDVLGAVARGLGVSLADAASDDAALTQLGHALAARPGSLVIIDNVEGAVASVARALAPWLEVPTGPRFVLTSRRKLGDPREHVIELSALSESDGISLFEARARRLAPEISATREAAALLRRLDGSPLAIELVAARAHVLAPGELLERFSRHLDLEDPRSHPPRHASLRATVLGSWELCTDEEQRALAVLSVFQGGFDFVAAERVLEGAGIAQEPSALVASLLDQSLLRRASAREGAARYFLYESVRELASEALGRMGELGARARRAHVKHFLEVAEGAREGALGAVAETVDLMAAEAENLLVAFRREPRCAVVLESALSDRLGLSSLHTLLTRSIEDATVQDASTLAELHLARSMVARRMGRPEATLGDAAEAERLAVLAGTTHLEAHALYIRATALGDLHGLAESSDTAFEAAEKARAHGHFTTLAKALEQAGWCALARSDLALAERCAEEALAIAADRGLVVVESLTNNLLGALSSRRGDARTALAHFERGLAQARAARSRIQETILLGNLSKCLTLTGDLEQARIYVEESLELSRLSGFRRSEGVQLAHLGAILLEQGHLHEARERAAQGRRVLSEVGYRRYEAAACAILGAVALEGDRRDAASEAFARTRELAHELRDGDAEAAAIAGLAVVAAHESLETARELLRSAEGSFTTPAPSEARALVRLREAWVDAAEGAGKGRRSASLLAKARKAIDETASLAASSSEVRVARRLLLQKLDSLAPSLVDATPPAETRRPATPRAEPSFQIVTRNGATHAEGKLDPVPFDLFFDAIRSVATVDGGRVTVDLSKKPIAARLLTVVLGSPADRFDKTRLFEEVWHVPFRTASQATTLYKAVDRLSRLLTDDSRRFLRWDEEGCLVLAAERPGLRRLTPDTTDSSTGR